MKGIAKAISIAAVFSFLIGGRAIHEITHTERVLSEMEGIGLAAVLGLVAAVVNGAAERIDDSGEPVSLALGAGSDKNKSE